MGFHSMTLIYYSSKRKSGETEAVKWVERNYRHQIIATNKQLKKKQEQHHELHAVGGV